jgi:hypothetical protein
MGKHAATPPLPVRLARAEEAAMLSQLCIGSKAVWGYDEAFMAPSRIRARGQATTNRARRRVGGECRRWKCCGDGGTGTGRRADTLDLDKLFVDQSGSAPVSVTRCSPMQSLRQGDEAPTGLRSSPIPTPRVSTKLMAPAGSARRHPMPSPADRCRSMK